MAWFLLNPRGVITSLVLVGGTAKAYSLDPSLIAATPAAIAKPRSPLAESVVPDYRDAVLTVLKNPTLTAEASEDEFVAHPHVYDWLLEHPDRAALAWQRMNVACLEIEQPEKGLYRWTDDRGGEVIWKKVGGAEGCVIWYATGKVKPGALLPVTPIKAVAVLSSPRKELDEKTRTAKIRPSVSLYLQADNRTSAALLRIIGPAAPRLARQGAEQFLLFFSGPARQVHAHPEELAKLLGPKK